MVILPEKLFNLCLRITIAKVFLDKRLFILKLLKCQNNAGFMKPRTIRGWQNLCHVGILVTKSSVFAMANN